MSALNQEGSDVGHRACCCLQEEGIRFGFLLPSVWLHFDVPGSGLQVGAVVVGLDRYISYYKLQYATLCLANNDSCM